MTARPPWQPNPPTRATGRGQLVLGLALGVGGSGALYGLLQALGRWA